MLYQLGRVAIAIVGLVLGLIGGWYAASRISEIFGWEYSQTFAGWVLPLIGLGIVGGSNLGLLAGIFLPHLWKRHGVTLRIKALSLPVTFLLGVVVLFPLLLLVHVGFNAISIEPTPIRWRHILGEACFQTVGLMTLSVLLKWLGLSKPAVV